MIENIRDISDSELIEIYSALHRISAIWASLTPQTQASLSNIINLSQFDRITNEMKGRDLLLRNEDLSIKQQRIMRYIQNYIQLNGQAPSFAEIQENVLAANGKPISSKSVLRYDLDKLEKMGYIRKRSKVARSIQVIQPV